jgi:hypothetical protein
VIVAPPSGNTSKPKPYEILHKGFDTLAVAIKACLPPELYEYLETHKQIAEQEQRDVLVTWQDVNLHLKGHGGMGYRFIASGGPMGANWAFKKPNSRDPWGIRVTVGSTFLATHGLRAAKAHIETTLDSLGIRTQASDFSISRVDYCVDVLTQNFELIPDNFVMHSSTNRRDYVTGFDQSVNGRSGKATSVTVGSTRARQVIIYDKRLEVIQKQKPHWWMIWNHSRAKSNLPSLDPKDRDNQIFRIEFRAGKDLLKDTWNIRTWEDLLARFGDLCVQTAQVVRYASPTIGDKNRARWPNHPIWSAACNEITGELFDMQEGATPNPIKEVHREQHISVIIKNITGGLITLAALEGRNFEDVPKFNEQTAKNINMDIRKNSEKFAKQLLNAKDRYVFICPQKMSNDAK